MDLDPHGKETDAAPHDNACVRNVKNRAIIVGSSDNVGHVCKEIRYFIWRENYYCVDENK